MRLHRLVLFPFLGALVACGGKTTGDAPADSGACASCVDSGVDVVVPADTNADALGDTTTILDSGPLGATPPPRPTAAGGDGATKWFVVKQWQLGLSDKTTGKETPSAWKDYGFDLDGRTTTADDSKTSRNSCHRVAGSPTGVLADGNLGRDNNFGAHVMQTIKSLKSDTESAVNLAVTSGGQTLLLRIDNVVGDDNAAVPGALYRTGALPSPPKFDGSDTYPVDASSVAGDLSAPIVTFPSGYMSGGYWVSGDVTSSSVSVPFALAGVPISLALQGGVFVFRVSDGSDGTLAGVMNASDFEPSFRPLLEQFGICPGNATYDQVVVTFKQSVDLVAGAPQFQDTSVDCDAISVGIGFAVAPVQKPTTISPTPSPPPSGC